MNIGMSPLGVIAKVLNFGLKVNEFELMKLHSLLD